MFRVGIGSRESHFGDEVGNRRKKERKAEKEEDNHGQMSVASN